MATEHPLEARPDHLPAVADSFRLQLLVALQSFWQAGVRNRILVLSGVMLAVILMTAYGTVLLNRWNAPFYNSLERKDVVAFVAQLRVFAIIAGFLLLLNVIQTWLNQMISLNMREGLSRDLVDQWLHGRRAFRLAVSSPLGINPDQRLHEDARKLAEMTTSLAIGLVQSTILLVSFIGVLWNLSSDFTFHIAGRSFSIPGYMVWGAILYALLASLLSKIVGRSLSVLNAERYAREADLRFSLMRANENLEAIALARAEQTERNHIHQTLDTVIGSIRNLAWALTNLTWVTAGFGWLAVVVPILIASPAYFAGDMTFGGLMMAAAAFTQVYSALRWYVDNFGAIADWRAALLRVTVFRSALGEQDDIAAAGDPSRLSVIAGKAAELRFDTVEICPRIGENGCEGSFRLKESPSIVHAGDHVMINGDQGINRKLFFNAIAGLWQGGSGTIELPAGEEILFVPQVAYLPEGPLGSLLAYPQPSSSFSGEDMAGALKQVGLERLTARLGESGRWDRLLDKDEQMLLAFAGILMRQPRWIVYQEVLEGLEPDTISTLVDLMAGMPEVTHVYIGRSEAYLATLKPTLLHLEKMT